MEANFNANLTPISVTPISDVLQELVHNFRRKGKFNDRQTDQAALAILDVSDPAKAKEERANRRMKEYVDGTIAHNLIGVYCPSISDREAANVTK